MTGKHYGNIRTDREFEDFRITLEAKVPSNGNSGIYLRGIYEVQVADSFNRAPDSHGIGGVYSRITPTSNPAKAPGEWQTFDITLIDRHVTVILNGVKIIDNQPLLGCTGGALWSDESRPHIYLQGDHEAVDYRNVVLHPVGEVTIPRPRAPEFPPALGLDRPHPPPCAPSRSFGAAGIVPWHRRRECASLAAVHERSPSAAISGPRFSSGWLRRSLRRFPSRFRPLDRRRMTSMSAPLNPDSSSVLDLRTGTIVATNGVQVVFRDATLTARTVHLDQELGEAVAKDPSVSNAAPKPGPANGFSTISAPAPCAPRI